MRNDPTLAVQRYYPQIYLACHLDHVRAVSTEYRLSAQDSSLLAHLDERAPVSASTLARHLRVTASTLSAAIKRLHRLGYLDRRASSRDRRNAELRLTHKGAEAMAATSVLDRARVAALLAELTPMQRRRAIAGLSLLAAAARRVRAGTQVTVERRLRSPLRRKDGHERQSAPDHTESATPVSTES